QQHNEQLAAALEPLRFQLQERERELGSKVQEAERDRDLQKHALHEMTIELERVRTETAQATRTAVERAIAGSSQRHAQDMEAATAPLRAQLGQAEQARTAAVNAVHSEYRQRNAATTQQLAETQAALAEIASGKSAVEEQLRNVESMKAAEVAQVRQV